MTTALLPLAVLALALGAARGTAAGPTGGPSAKALSRPPLAPSGPSRHQSPPCTEEIDYFTLHSLLGMKLSDSDDPVTNTALAVSILHQVYTSTRGHDAVSWLGCYFVRPLVPPAAAAPEAAPARRGRGRAAPLPAADTATPPRPHPHILTLGPFVGQAEPTPSHISLSAMSDEDSLATDLSSIVIASGAALATTADEDGRPTDGPAAADEVRLAHGGAARRLAPELVIPVVENDGGIVAVLHVKGLGFSYADQLGLERAVLLLARACDWRQTRLVPVAAPPVAVPPPAAPVAEAGAAGEGEGGGAGDA